MELVGNAYQIQGVDVLQLAKEHGSPLFVYDAEVIKRQYDRLNIAISYKHKKLNFACKSLNNVNILRYMRSLGAGLDTVSIEEVQLGLHAGYSPDEIIYTPNCVSFEEITKAVELGVRINIDNLSILEQFGTMHAGSTIFLSLQHWQSSGLRSNQVDISLRTSASGGRMSMDWTTQSIRSFTSFYCLQGFARTRR